MGASVPEGDLLGCDLCHIIVYRCIVEWTSLPLILLFIDKNKHISSLHIWNAPYIQDGRCTNNTSVLQTLSLSVWVWAWQAGSKLDFEKNYKNFAFNCASIFNNFVILGKLLNLSENFFMQNGCNNTMD